MNQDDRRSQVCGMRFLPIADASVGNFPGADFIRSAVAGKLSEYLPESLKRELRYVRRRSETRA